MRSEPVRLVTVRIMTIDARDLERIERAIVVVEVDFRLEYRNSRRAVTGQAKNLRIGLVLQLHARRPVQTVAEGALMIGVERLSHPRQAQQKACCQQQDDSCRLPGHGTIPPAREHFKAARPVIRHHDIQRDRVDDHIERQEKLSGCGAVTSQASDAAQRLTIEDQNRYPAGYRPETNGPDRRQRCPGDGRTRTPIRPESPEIAASWFPA